MDFQKEHELSAWNEALVTLFLLGQSIMFCAQLTLKVLVTTIDAQWEGMGM